MLKAFKNWSKLYIVYNVNYIVNHTHRSDIKRRKEKFLKPMIYLFNGVRAFSGAGKHVCV